MTNAERDRIAREYSLKTSKRNYAYLVYLIDIGTSEEIKKYCKRRIKTDIDEAIALKNMLQEIMNERGE